MNERKCSDCGIDHKWQEDNFPVGMEVVVIGEFTYPSGIPEAQIKVAIGETGLVDHHCSDGRAAIKFAKHGVHTFHFITDYLIEAKRIAS